FPAFKWTQGSIIVPTPEGAALPNPRAWTKARDKSEFVLQNFVIAPAQAAHASQSDWSGSAAGSATVRVGMGEEGGEEGAAWREAQTTPDLASTFS
ncbi:hypothetical protein ACJOMK_06440, partial [Mycoplasmopsis synoviae]